MEASAKRRFRIGAGLGRMVIAVVVVLTASSRTHAGATKLVKDIERSSRLCEISEFVRAGDVLYFGTPANCRGGMALWRSDGTLPGTRTVGSFVPGPKNLRRVQPLLAVGDLLYFGLSDGASLGSRLVELWRTDGTDAGTWLVREFDAPLGVEHHPYAPPTEAVVDGKLLFFVSTPGYSVTPWVSDGSPQGTHPLADVRTLGMFGVPVEYLEHDGVLFFVAPAPDGFELYRTDGTPAGTFLLHDLGAPDEDDSSILPEVEIGPDGAIWFAPTVSHNQREVWRTEGTAATTSRVATLPFASTWALTDGTHVVLEARRGIARVWRLDPATGALDPLLDFAPPPLGLNGLDVVARRDGVLFFMADIARLGEGPALWRTDGTVAGTFRLYEGYAYRDFVALGDGFAFAPDTGGRPELWHSDGTTAGTVRIHGPADYWGYESFVPLGDELLFVGDGGDFNADLHRTDGTAGGTTSVRHLPGAPNRVGTLGDVALLHIDGTLWRSDGTSDGTYPVRELGVFTWGSWPWQLTDVDGTLFFAVAGRGGTDNEIWRSDGTRAGTTLVADFPDGDGDVPLLLTPFGDRLLFRRGPRQLWESDGTSDGTRMLADVSDGDPATEIRDIHEHAGAAYVAVGSASATDGTLLRVDGDGTLAAQPVASAAVSSLTSFDGDLFFSAPSAPEVGAVWRSDGTAGGTAPIATFSALSRRRRPEIGKLLPGTDAMYFSVGRRGRTDLWRTDGTTAGTARVAALPLPPGATGKGIVGDGAVLDDLLVFSFASDIDGGPNLWRSDGTESGTRSIATIFPYLGLTSFTVANGKVFFVSPGYFFPSSLWVTDGTAEGTELLNDRVLDGSLVAVGDQVYYCGIGAEIFRNELWRSDGTTIGTLPVFGRNDGCFGAPAASGGRLFFTFDAPRYGPELWSMPLAP